MILARGFANVTSMDQLWQTTTNFWDPFGFTKWVEDILISRHIHISGGESFRVHVRDL